MGLQFHRPKLSGESCFTHFLNYGGLCKERSTEQVTDTFQRRALPKKIMETLKKSIFSFTIANLVNNGIVHFLYMVKFNVSILSRLKIMGFW